MTKNATKYEVRANGEVSIRSKKSAAITLAMSFYHDAQNAIDVDVVTNAGTNVFHMAAVVAKPGRAKPFARTEVPNFEFEPVEGADEVAYVRNRIKTVVLRKNDHTGYVVLHTPTGVRVEVENTKEARHHTNTLQLARKLEAEKAKADAKAAKDAAKAEKAAAKEAALRATAEVLADAEVKELVSA